MPKPPTTLSAFRRWLTTQFDKLEALADESSFFDQLDIAAIVEQANRLALRFGAGDLVQAERATMTPRDGLSTLGRLLAWTERPAELLTVKDVAQMLGTSSRSVWRMLSAGELPSPIKIGGLTKWRRGDIATMIELGR